MKKLILVLMAICTLTASMLGCTHGNPKIKGTEKINWNDKFVEHEDFTDLGDYVIDLGEITMDDFECGLDEINTKLDAVSTPACTAVVKRNSKGEVIVGRNMDLEVSNYAAYIAHYVDGEHQAIGFGYNNKGTYTYAELQQMDSMPEGFRETQAVAVTDAFNEEGLYIQCNMRTGSGHLSDGTNPGAKRINMGTLAAIVAQNCATVEEALNFIRNDLDVYSTYSSSDSSARSGWDLAYLIADATGEYGIIEFADNQIYYTPYANGHSNTYIHPNLNKYNIYSGGFGRQALAMDEMINAETAEDMFEAIHKADWCREILDVKYSYKDENGVAHFVDKDGNPSLDYRTELASMFCVSDDNEYLPESDEWIKTLKSLSEGEAVTCPEETKNKINELSSEIGPQGITGTEENLQDAARNILTHYHKNCTADWLTDDANFDSTKQAFIDYFNSLNAFDLLDDFFAGEEQGLRDSGDIFTTGMCFGVNCNKKYLKVRFMEHESCVYEYQW